MYRILIVDDSHNLKRLKVNAILKNHNISEVKDTSNFNSIMREILSFNPHAIFFNIAINNGKGLTILKEIIKLNLDIKYIAVGPSTDYLKVREAFLIGIDDYLLNNLEESAVKNCLQVITDKINITVEDSDLDPILRIRYSDLSKVVNNVIKFVKNKYNDEITLKEIANNINFNSGYLGRLFLKETKMKFTEYLMLYRMFMAKQLITMTTDTISKIANDVGYTSTSYFYTHFNKIYGFSPNELRRNIM